MIETSSSFTRNAGYYIIAHAAKFIPPNSTRIASNVSGNPNSVAFKRPDGKRVLLIENDDATAIIFNIKFNGRWVVVSLDGGSVGTFIW